MVLFSISCFKFVLLSKAIISGVFQKLNCACIYTTEWKYWSNISLHHIAERLCQWKQVVKFVKKNFLLVKLCIHHIILLHAHTLLINFSGTVLQIYRRILIWRIFFSAWNIAALFSLPSWVRQWVQRAFPMLWREIPHQSSRYPHYLWGWIAIAPQWKNCKRETQEQLPHQQIHTDSCCKTR